MRLAWLAVARQLTERVFAFIIGAYTAQMLTSASVSGAACTTASITIYNCFWHGSLIFARSAALADWFIWHHRRGYRLIIIHWFESSIHSPSAAHFDFLCKVGL